MYNMMTIFNTAYMKAFKKVDSKSSYHNEKKFFFSFLAFI